LYLHLSSHSLQSWTILTSVWAVKQQHFGKELMSNMTAVLH